VAAFRNAIDPLLVLAANLLGLAMLNGLMSLFDMEWNFMNLCALTLTMGLGVDYGIHVIFALRSGGCEWREALGDVGKALGLCAATTIAGFASLGAATTEGLASLGTACALGVAINALVALFLLPLAWRLIHRKNPSSRVA
jgi:predicted RND superfamily exporter protein